MKKVVLMLVMLFTISANAFSEGIDLKNRENFEKYDFNNINFKKLASFLDLSEDQMELANEFSNELAKDMEFAFYENDGDARKRVVKNLLDKNVKNMSYVLSEKQYRKYLRVLNVTLINRGFIVY